MTTYDRDRGHRPSEQSERPEADTLAEAPSIVTAAPFVTRTDAERPAQGGPVATERAGAPVGEFAPGAVVMARYQIESVAGVGGMGTVYKARDRDGQVVALKILKPSLGHLDGRFFREARLLMELQHPAIVRYLNSGSTPAGARFLVMEWLDGCELAERLQSKRLSLRQSLALGHRLAEALGFVHERGIVHRDVKPHNIFLPNNRLESARLLDFGVARWSSATPLTSTGMQLGTPGYMAPEQIRGTLDIDARADVFSLGCILHECITGARAYAGADPMSVFYKILLDQAPRAADKVHGLPAPVTEFLERMLANDREQRPSNGREVANELQRLIAELPEPSTRTQVEFADTLRIDPNKFRPNKFQARADTRPLPMADTLSESEASDRALTDVELHVLSLVVTAAGETTRDGPSETASAGPLEHLQRRFQSPGVRFDNLADGSLVAVIESLGTAADQAAVAARCALAVQAMAPRWSTVVATGRAVIGQLALSDVIDRATALMAVERAAGAATSGPARPIRLDPMSAELLAARFDIERDDRGPVLLGPRREWSAPLSPGPAAPLVGRRRELASLVATLEECVEDQVARAVVVSAPSGMGKSRLLREFWRAVTDRWRDGSGAKHPGERPVEVWLTRCDPVRREVPLSALTQALRYTANIREDDPPERRRDELSARVARAIAGVENQTIDAVLSEFVSAPDTGVEPQTTDPQMSGDGSDPRLMQERVRYSCAKLLSADAHRRPVLFIVDDLQWCDLATMDFLDERLEELSERPMMVLMLGRPEVSERFPKLLSRPEVIDMHLRPLSSRSAGRLAGALAGEALSEAQIAALLARSEGNALFLEELIRVAVKSSDEYPEAVVATLHTRLERLPADARRVVRAASIFGERFSCGGVAAVLGAATSVDIGARLGALCEADVLEPVRESTTGDEAEYSFRHDLLRRAAYNMSTDTDRRLGHATAGRWLADVVGGAHDPHRIADHLERAGAFVEAAPYLVRAARAANRAGDFSIAVTLAQRAEQGGAQGQILGQLRAVQAEAHIWRQDLVRASDCGEQALTLLAPGSRVWYEVAETVSWTQTRLGRTKRLAARARGLFEGPPTGHDRMGWLLLSASLSRWLVIDGHAGAGDALLSAIDRELANQPGHGADMTAGAQADLAVRARIYAARSHRAVTFAGDLAEGLRFAELAVACFEQSGDRCRACLRSVGVGFIQLSLGLYGEAEARLRSALADATELGLQHLADSAMCALSGALTHRGSLVEARDLAGRAAESFERQFDARGSATSRYFLALAQLADNRLEDARSEAEAVLSLSAEAGQRQVWARTILARIALLEGRTDPALALAEQALEQVRALGGLDFGEADARLVHIEALEASGRRNAAHPALELAVAELRQRAERIDPGPWRESFLGAVDTHARLLALAELWR